MPAGVELDAIRQMMLSHPGVAAVHDLRVWALGSTQPVLTAHIVLRDGTVYGEPARIAIAQALEDRFNVHHATLQVERTVCEDGHGHA